VSRPVPFSFEVEDWKAPIGLFGVFGDVTIRFRSLPASVRIYAQDLKADKAEDITGRTSIRNSAVTFPGELLRRIGFSAASFGDKSDPGLVIKIVKK
jgi:hypothetical protein